MNKEFKAHVNNIADQTNNFITSLISKIKDANIVVLDEDDNVVSYKHLNAAVDKICNNIRDIPKVKRDINKNNHKKNGGFNNPIFITESMISFFNEADFGYYYDEDGNKQDKLKNRLNLINDYGLSTIGILTGLFSIYRILTKCYDEDNKNYIISTDLMKEVFSNEFNQIEQEDIKNNKEDKFTADSFRLARIRTVFSKCIDNDATEEEKEQAKTKLEELDDEYNMIKSTLKFLKSNK